MSEDKLAKQIDLAHQASELLNNNPAFVAAVEKLGQDIFDRGRRSKDREERERVWIALDLLDDIRKALVTMMANGKLSVGQLEDLTSGRARKHFGIV